MKNYIFIFIFSLLSVFAKADEANTLWQLANHAYQNKNYDAATHLYDSMLKKNIVNSELYYNAGNAYYKNHKLGMAIWYFEKAYQQSPNDEDIEMNLKIARLKLVDKIDVVPEFVLLRWAKKLINLLSIKSWAIITIFFFWLMLCGWLLYYFTFNYVVLGKRFIWFGLIFGLVFLAVAYVSNRNSVSEKFAIVIATNTTIKSAPDETSSDLFLIHEGLKLKLNKTNGNWVNVSLADGKVGWCNTSDLKNL